MQINLETTSFMIWRNFFEKGIFIPRIPQYLIIGKDGEVIENDALRPSNEEDLYTQLKNSLNQ